ncbi:hypothetical protein LTR62_003326 [Meristemomyces frigidus]|uniref:Mitochondrial K+-H+ exchange-related-domain-containing protein n=1 Tax=Meristemomyces frigidus TaxID=1508187 RepID=A0AAN7TS71_9PEZI|nr:hypothetical protein LTR62_003326 [Meristemomyces frigidus]
MRIFLLPISTRRTLLYCERIQETLQTPAQLQQQPYTDRILNRATTTWATWEKAEKGWQKQITVYANQLLKRIPYEEWGLKSFPPLTKKRLEELDAQGGKQQYECLYPGAFVKGGEVSASLRRLATERQGLHRKRMWWSIALMPISAPFTLVPIIPNLPFFWLCFRAYSHYRALYGGKFLEHILQKGMVKTTDSRMMDGLYTAGLVHGDREKARGGEVNEGEIGDVVKDVEARSGAGEGEKEVMLLKGWNGKLIAESFGLLEMEGEIVRAVEQVEKEVLGQGQQQGVAEQAKEVVEDARASETGEKAARS